MNLGRPHLDLRATRSLACTGQLLLACTAVLTAGAGSSWAMLLLVVITSIRLRRELRGESPDKAGEPTSVTKTILWSTSLLLVLGLSLVRAFVWQEILDAGIDFLIFAACQRSLDPTIAPARRCAQQLMIGTVAMMIAAAINTELSFVPLLGLFLLLSVLCLQLNAALGDVESQDQAALRRIEAEAATHLRHIISASLRMAAFAGLCAAIVFLFFPRFGIGAFLRGALPTQSTSGFSDEVQLGHFGKIREDTRIVMHLRNLESSGPFARPLPRPTLPIHLRGTAFDSYTNGRWSHSPAALPAPLKRAGGYYMLKHRVVDMRPDVFADLHMEVILSDIGTDLLFAASSVVGVNLHARGMIEARSRLVGGVDEQFRVLDRPPGAIKYEFLSRRARPAPKLLAEVPLPDAQEREQLAAYLQIPEALRPKLEALAETWAGSAEGRMAKVEALITQLRRYRYTTDAEVSASPGVDPIEVFLFDVRAGHCEYFSTALTLLARASGLPARNVNGYHGATYNPHGNFYAVRQSNAHSWTEVYFPGHGWLHYDATPPDGRRTPGRSGLLAQGRAWVESLQDQYLRYVIDYDLKKQLELLSFTGVDAQGGLGRTKLDRDKLARTALMVAGVMAMVLLFIRRRRFAGMAGDHRLQQALRQVMAALRGLGFEPEPHESSLRFFSRAARTMDEQGHSQMAERLLNFATDHEQARFGRGQPRSSDVSVLLRHARAVAQGLRRIR